MGFIVFIVYLHATSRRRYVFDIQGVVYSGIFHFTVLVPPHHIWRAMPVADVRYDLADNVGIIIHFIVVIEFPLRAWIFCIWASPIASMFVVAIAL